MGETEGDALNTITVCKRKGEARVFNQLASFRHVITKFDQFTPHCDRLDQFTHIETRKTIQYAFYTSHQVLSEGKLCNLAKTIQTCYCFCQRSLKALDQVQSRLQEQHLLESYTQRYRQDKELFLRQTAITYQSSTARPVVVGIRAFSLQ